LDKVVLIKEELTYYFSIEPIIIAFSDENDKAFTRKVTLPFSTQEN
jgi:hypothetical protein